MGRIFRHQHIAFDPTRFVALINEQHPDLTEVAEAMARVTEVRSEEPGYTRIVSDRRTNKPGAEWQFEWNVVLRDPERGMVVLDVLTGPRIGGIEFVDEIPLPKDLEEFLGPAS